MKRLVLLSLVAAILSLAGCRWFCDLLLDNLDQPPKRRPGMSDESYARVLEEHRLSENVREMRESENADHMEQYGYPKYPNVPCPPYKDDRTAVEKAISR